MNSLVQQAICHGLNAGIIYDHANEISNKQENRRKTF